MGENESFLKIETKTNKHKRNAKTSDTSPS